MVVCPAGGGEVRVQMFTVYILRNKQSGRHYIGSTNNLIRRLDEHNRGQTFSTRYGKNSWELIYSEEYESDFEAKKRERQIKSFKGGEAFKRLVRR